MTEENPLGMFILLVCATLLSLGYIFTKAVLEARRERKNATIERDRRKCYERGLADALFLEKQARLDREHELTKARKEIKKTCLAEHDLSGCREELLGLPEPM